MQPFYLSTTPPVNHPFTPPCTTPFTPLHTTHPRISHPFLAVWACSPRPRRRPRVRPSAAPRCRPLAAPSAGIGSAAPRRNLSGQRSAESPNSENKKTRCRSAGYVCWDRIRSASHPPEINRGRRKRSRNKKRAQCTSVNQIFLATGAASVRWRVRRRLPLLYPMTFQCPAHLKDKHHTSRNRVGL